MSFLLLKLNGILHAPAGISRPSAPADWEGGEFLLPARPIRPIGGADGVFEPQRGDVALIWCHEEEEHGAGLGLTATGRIVDVGSGVIHRPDRSEPEDALAIRISQIELFDPPLGLVQLPKPVGNAVLDWLHIHRRHHAWHLSTEQYRDLFNFVQQRQASQREAIAARNSTDTLTAAAQAVSRNRDALRNALDEAREIAYGLRPVRPNQSAFRRRLMALYRGRCVLTRVRVGPALEAAHVFPWTGDPVLDEPDNGLILRRDLHALFDAGLFAIHPVSRRINMAAELHETIYGQYDGRLVEHHVAPEYITARWQQYLRIRDQALIDAPDPV